MATIYDYNKIIKIVHLSRLEKLFTFLKRFMTCHTGENVKNIRSSHLSYSIKKLVLIISQNSQKNICARACVFLNKVAGLRPATSLKKETPTFGKFGKFLRTSILNNICERLLLETEKYRHSQLIVLVKKMLFLKLKITLSKIKWRSQFRLKFQFNEILLLLICWYFFRAF